MLDNTGIHLRRASLQELETTFCEDCNTNNLAEYACINHMKDNEPVCVDCCLCHREE